MWQVFRPMEVLYRMPSALHHAFSTIERQPIVFSNADFLLQVRDSWKVVEWGCDQHMRRVTAADSSVHAHGLPFTQGSTVGYVMLQKRNHSLHLLLHNPWVVAVTSHSGVECFAAVKASTAVLRAWELLEQWPSRMYVLYEIPDVLHPPPRPENVNEQSFQVHKDIKQAIRWLV